MSKLLINNNPYSVDTNFGKWEIAEKKQIQRRRLEAVLAINPVYSQNRHEILSALKWIVLSMVASALLHRRTVADVTMN